MKAQLQSLGFTDLYSLYQFVLSRAMGRFGDKKDAKKMVEERLKEIEQELYLRSFGYNPFTEELKPILEITGMDPEKVVSQFKAQEKTNEEPQK